MTPFLFNRYLLKLIVVVLLAPFIIAGVNLVVFLYPPKIDSVITPEDRGWQYREVEFVTEDGLTLNGWYLPRQSDSSVKEGDTTIILLHGYPADKGNILPVTDFLVEDHNLFYFDFRSLGASEGSYSSLGMRERKDLRAALDFLRQEKEQDKFGLWGLSMGGAVALEVAPEEPGVEAVVTVASYGRLSDMAYDVYPVPGLNYLLGGLINFYTRIFLNLDTFEMYPARSAAQYHGAVFLIHSPEDQVIPFSHGQMIKNSLNARDNTELWFPSGGHGALPWDEHQQRVGVFFDRYLK